MDDHVLALLAAKPGRVRDGLQALLAAMPQIETIELANDSASALRMIARHWPALVLLDTNLPANGVWTVLEQVKTRWPQVRCLILTDNNRQRHMAQAIGADAMLIKGFPAMELFGAIKQLLSKNEQRAGQTTSTRIAAPSVKPSVAS